MSLQRISSGSRILIGVLIFFGLLTYCKMGDSRTDMGEQKTERRDESPIAGLELLLEQINDTTITATVTNKNSGFVTILSYDSPLDPLALKIGLISITPVGADTPLELPTIQLRRIWPPSAEALITIAPGESAKNEIVLKPDIMSLKDLGHKGTVVFKGQWQAVWAKTRDEISKSSQADPHGSSDAFQGDFSFGKLEITIK